MKPYLTFALAAALALGSANAAVTLGLSDTVGNPTTVSILPGGSFTIRVTLTSSAELTTGLSYQLATTGAGNGQFRITARNTTGSLFPDLTTTDGIALAPTIALLDPTTDIDLGGLIADVLAPNIAGSFLVADLTIESLGTIAPGSYTISTNGVTVSNDAFDTINVGSSSYNVVVVPEASHALLCGLGLMSLAARRRRN